MPQKVRIIIADDHQVFLDGIQALLKEDKDIEIAGQATDGNSLVEKTLLLKPEIVVTDIQMPVKDGIEAAKEIRRIRPEIKILVLSMLNESMYIKKLLELGIDGYVLKTANKEELIQAIKTVSAGKKYFNPEVASQLLNNYASKPVQRNSLAMLTKREKEIIAHIAQGLTDKEIAEKVFLSPLTVITHRKNLLSKLGLKNKVELTRFAIDNKLI